MIVLAVPSARWKGQEGHPIKALVRGAGEQERIPEKVMIELSPEME